MLKILKRKVSRSVMEAPDLTQLPTAEANGQEKEQGQQGGGGVTTTSPTPLPLQYPYQRPFLLGRRTEAELESYTSHFHRPVVNGGSDLPDGIGYAEVMNAGKSKYNEDQATVVEGKLVGINGVCIPYTFVGVYDGHGGSGAAIKVSKELHNLVHEGLEDVLPYMLFPEKRRRDSMSEEVEDDDDDEAGEDFEHEEDERVEVKMTLDQLVCGTLESSFWAMDRLILRDKETYRITGGTTVLVALFICNKLYVANAGDSRALVVSAGGQNKDKDNSKRPAGSPYMKEMSFDFTPSSDRQRIQHIAYQRPELLRHPATKEKLYNRHILSRKVTKEDIGISIMYQDFYMSGWSCRDVSSEDVNLIPVITGRGKQCRLLSTVGVARGLGDHDLLAKGSGIKCKEFLSPQPEVRILDLDSPDLNGDELLVLGTDGLWDVLTNAAVRKFVVAAEGAGAGAGAEGAPSEQDLAHDLVLKARGERTPDMYWEMSNGRLASGDDITATVVRLVKAKKVFGDDDKKKKVSTPL